MKKLLTILIMIALISSCHRKLITSSEKTTETNTSVTVTKDSTSIQDTIVQVPADSSEIQIPVTINAQGEITMPKTVVKNTRSVLTAQVLKGILTGKCVCKELELTVQYQQRTIEKLTKENQLKQKENIQVQTIEVKFIPTWVKILAWIGATMSLLFIGIIAFKIYKLIYKIP